MKRKKVLVQVSLKPKESEKERLKVLVEREKHYGSYTSMAKLHNKLQRAIRTHENFDNLPKTNALKPLAFSYGDTRLNAFRRANME